MRRVLIGALAALLGSLVLTAAAPASPSQKPPTLPEPPKPVKADRDGNKVFDDLEVKLAKLGPTDTLSVIVRLKLPPDVVRLGALMAQVGGFQLTHSFTILNAFAATMMKAQIEALLRIPELFEIEENSLVHAFNDSAQQSFGVTKARADVPSLDGDRDGNPAVYSRSDLVAAVIDTGIDPGHQDLNGGKVIAFKDFVNGRTTAYDDNGHGTHVAGTIAGDVFKGVAPSAGLVGVKVLDATGSGTMADVTAAIDWVVANKDVYGIEAINLSLGTGGCSDGTDAASVAVNRAEAAGLVVSVSAGNEGPGTCTIGSPAAATGALTVGAMADTGVNGFKQAYFSSRGRTADGRIKPDVSAPGVSITSARAGTLNGYAVYSGTSMAAPFIAGVALLMRDANPSLTPGQVRSLITATAVDWGRGGDNRTAGTTGTDVDYGAGRLDAYAALAAAGAPLSSPPAAPTHQLKEGSFSGTGAQADYPLSVTDTQFPIAATLIIPALSAGSASSPDFDLYLYSQSGALVGAAETTRRQDELGYRPTATGIYTLRVRSYSGGGGYFVDVSAGLTPAPPPTPDTTPPAAPTGLTATAGDGRVALDWADNTEPDLAGYRVYRRNADGTWPSAPLASPTASAYTDAGLTNGVTYSYRVAALDRGGNESAAAEASGTPSRPPIFRAYLPTGYTVVSGVLRKGDLSRLRTNDGRRLEVDAVNAGGTYVAEVLVSTTIGPSELATLRVLSVMEDGNVSSAAAALTLSLFNWRTGSWTVLDGPRTGVTSDATFTGSPPGPASDYVSPAGEIRWSVKGTRAGGSFRLRTDWVRFTIEY